MYQTETTTTTPSPWAFTAPFNAPTEDELAQKEYTEIVGNAQALCDLLKTPDLDETNVSLINALISQELLSLTDCGCEDEDEVDLTGMSLEEMIEYSDSIGV